MLISVVIPTRNRATVLAGALESLARQEAGSGAFEVLVIDNGSTDTTADVADAARAVLLELRCFQELRPGLHAGRHRGMREARGEVLAYIDDDVRVAPGWIAALRAAFADPAVALVGGNNRPRFEVAPPPWLDELWRQGRAIPGLSVLELEGGARDIDPGLVWGCNFSIRRAVLEEARGFHPDAMPEHLLRFRGDGEMPVGRYVVQSGRRCWFHPGASVEHLVPAGRMTLAYFRRRAWLQGYSDSYTRLRAGEAGPSSTVPRGLHDAWHFARDVAARGWQRARLEAAIRRGHEGGFREHQALFKADAELRAWVLRKDYLDV